MLNKWLKDNSKPLHRSDPFSMFRQAPRLECIDGTSLSIQVSESHYCNPRKSDAFPYSSVEVGFPDIAPPDSWKPYCEEWDKPTDTVYGYVPIKLVEEFINDHGGIKN